MHRGHRDHLPMCMWDMVNERLAALSHMTEGTLRAYEDRKAAEAQAAPDARAARKKTSKAPHEGACRADRRVRL